MRIRLQSSPSLPFFKAWFCPKSETSILELKQNICADVQALREADIVAQDVTLLLDDFELLESSPLNVIRDGDLIFVKRTAVQSSKRKADHVDDNVKAKRRKVSRIATLSPPPVAPAQARQTAIPPNKAASQRPDYESDSSSPSSSDSELESSKPSSSESSSAESSSDSDSDESRTSSESAPTSLPSKPTKPITQPANVSQEHLIHHIPPGHGKSSTHNRNLRRRRKKQFEKLASQTEPKSVNDIPLGKKDIPLQLNKSISNTPGPSTSPDKTPAPGIMMASLSNKNKRRGFKNTMTNPLAAKIVFDSSDEAQNQTAETRGASQVVSEALPFAEAPRDEIVSASWTTRPRLIPPSEKQENGLIPSNMFVTSVDVEEGLRPQKRKKKARAVAEAEAEVEMDFLDYGEADQSVDVVTTQRSPERTAVPIQAWTDVALSAAGLVDDITRQWDNLVKVTDRTQVIPGTLLAWKELGINPSTFTPEMLVKVGTVVKFADDKVVLEQQTDSNEMTLSFGGAVMDEDIALEPTLLEVGWDQIAGGDYKFYISS
ncbi:unnamed protein product [Somion occarium]|uniref:Coilin n=1 Tax=Somion occarium TaxID=3059160 RepID=A0ABP1D9N4_9APHY